MIFLFEPDDHEPMNVLITGSTEDNVEKAAKLVQELLVPVTTSENELKAREFRQLALMSGKHIDFFFSKLKCFVSEVK